MEKTGGTGAGAYYYLRNRQGSVLALADVDGEIVESYRYSAYGKARLFDNAGTEISASAVGNPYGYTGRRLDPESGLLYYRSRYYSPDLGRFLSRDPAGHVDGLNVYAYVRGNPLAYIDPWGLSARLTVDGDFFLPGVAQAKYGHTPTAQFQIPETAVASWKQTERMEESFQAIYDAFGALPTPLS